MLKFPEFTFTIEMFNIGEFVCIMHDDKLMINDREFNLDDNKELYTIAITYYELMKEFMK